MTLHRYWIKFSLTFHDSHPIGVIAGCGVTAYDYDDALELLQSTVFNGQALPKIETVIADVDISTLDPNHVLPNIGNPLARGIWFPLGYD